MDGPPFAVNEQQRKKNSDQLTLLVVFHFVFVAVCLAGIGFLFLFLFVNPNPDDLERMLNPIWPYFFMGAFFLASALLNVISAFRLMARKGRMFSLVVAGLNCVQWPFGTVLGICTIAFLRRDSVRALYRLK